jgi:hypothetical protein
VCSARTIPGLPRRRFRSRSSRRLIACSVRSSRRCPNKPQRRFGVGASRSSWVSASATSSPAVVFARLTCFGGHDHLGRRCDRRPGRRPVGNPARAAANSGRPDLSLPGHPNVFAVTSPCRQSPFPSLPNRRSKVLSRRRQIAAKLASEPTKPFHIPTRVRWPRSGATGGGRVSNGLRFHGFIGWLMWLGLHLIELMGFRNCITSSSTGPGTT